jgi:manganese transport protein
VLAIGVEPTQTLVISQVVLSFGIPFALVPLILLTSRKTVMGNFVNARRTTALGTLVAGLIIGLNLFLIHSTLFG